MEPVEQGDPSGDEAGPQNQCSHHSPEQHPMLVSKRDGESREDDGEDEQVVNRQALLEEVSGQVLPGRPGTPVPSDHPSEAEAEGDPNGGPPRSLAYGDFVGLAVEDHEVDDHHDQDDAQGCYPGKDRNVHIDSYRLSLNSRGSLRPGSREALPGTHGEARADDDAFGGILPTRHRQGSRIGPLT
jgi:hypothetical protein